MKKPMGQAQCHDEQNIVGSVDQAIARVVRQELAQFNLRTKMLLTFQESVEYLNTSETGLYDLINEGKLRPVRYDRRPRFDIRDLDKFIEESKQAS